MKKAFLSIMACIALLSAWAQEDSILCNYQSVFGEEEASWFVGLGDPWYGTLDDCYHISTSDSVFIGDTAYLRCVDYEFDHSCEPNFAHYFFRETPDHSKLYVRTFHARLYGADTLPEILVMDLNLGVGDSIKYPGRRNGEEFGIRITNVDYVDNRKVLTTDWVRSFCFRPPFDTLRYVEGVGPTFGLKCFDVEGFWGWGTNGGDYTQLLCYYKDSILEYQPCPPDQNPIFGGVIHHHGWRAGCFVGGLMSGIENNNEPQILLSPNPTDGMFWVEVPSAGQIDVDVRGIGGELLVRRHSDGPKMELDLRSLPSGTYIVIVRDDKVLGKKKIVKL